MILGSFDTSSINIMHDRRADAALEVMALRLRLQIHSSNMIDTIIDYRLQHAHNAVLAVECDFLENQGPSPMHHRALLWTA